MTACAVCGREAKGFGYVHRLKPDRYPTYRFCSMRCLDGGSAVANRNNGMIDKTDIEKQAIKDARRNFAEVLTELGLMAPFFDRAPEEIDRLIEACIDGFQEAMHRLARGKQPPFDDPIPF